MQESITLLTPVIQVNMHFLGPNKGKRYHPPEFHHRGQLRSREELFNRVHSSVQSVIERTFGVWKKRWRISQNMLMFLYKTQVHIVVVSMAFHNYIRRKSIQDVAFNEFEQHPDSCLMIFYVMLFHDHKHMKAIEPHIVYICADQNLIL